MNIGEIVRVRETSLRAPLRGKVGRLHAHFGRLSAWWVDFGPTHERTSGGQCADLPNADCLWADDLERVDNPEDPT